MFDSFHLSDPDVDGQCSTDFFLATGGSPVPQLCGLNTGQHRNIICLYSFDFTRIFSVNFEIYSGYMLPH